jgi:hypothetical protein
MRVFAVYLHLNGDALTLHDPPPLGGAAKMSFHCRIDARRCRGASLGDDLSSADGCGDHAIPDRLGCF